MTLFKKENRKRERKSLGSILDVFDEKITELKELAVNQTEHLDRIDRDMFNLETQKGITTEEHERTKVIIENVSNLLGITKAPCDGTCAEDCKCDG